MRRTDVLGMGLHDASMHCRSLAWSQQEAVSDVGQGKPPASPSQVFMKDLEVRHAVVGDVGRRLCELDLS